MSNNIFYAPYNEIRCDRFALEKLVKESEAKDQRIAELEEQLKNTIKLPCKIDDIVYWVDYDNTIKQGKVFEISVHIDGMLVHTGARYCLKADKICLTYEEAQAKLEELTAKNV